MNNLFEAIERAFDNLKEDERKTYEIELYQIDNIQDVRYAFMDWDFAEDKFNFKDYRKVDDYDIEANSVQEALEKVFTISNTSSNQSHRSVSMSDVLVVDGKSYYTDTFGFKEISKEKNEMN